MNFSSASLAEIDGLLDVNRDFCKLEMQQSRLGKAERDQPALESKGFARRCRNLRASATVSVRVAEKASRDALPNCAVLP